MDINVDDKIFCISGSRFLTKGKIYTIEAFSGDYVCVKKVGDKSLIPSCRWFKYSENFRTLSELREEKIEYILSQKNEN